MKNRSLIIGVLLVALATALPRQAQAVTDEQFQQMQLQMQQQSQEIQDLQKARQEDKQEIQKLKDQLGVTQKTTDDTQKKVEETQKKVEETQQAAAQVQPVHPVPVEGILATHNFSLVGDAEVQFGKTEGQHSTFMLADFAPIFLYRAGDNVLFEAGFDIGYQSNHPQGSGATTQVNMSFATIDYLFNDYVTVVAGEMLLPLGTYNERNAGWLNKIPDDPLPYSQGILPGNGTGIQLRGSKSIGDSGQMVTYSIYGVNGPQSIDGTGNSTNIDFADVVNQHATPSAGGRIGWFYPWRPHWDIEFGESGESGTWDNNGKYQWSGNVVDAALHLSPYFEAKGEYIYTWQQTADRGTIAPRGWWVQAGYKLSGLQLELPMVNSVELVYRYDTVNDGLGTETDRQTVGCVYYITNTFQFEGDYEFVHSTDPSQANNELIVQLSYGF
jgi:type II secretory pathway pseudopilin PulG